MLFARRPNQVESAHALPRIMAAYQKSWRVYWEHDEIDPRSVCLNYLFISLGGNLSVHLGIDRSAEADARRVSWAQPCGGTL